MAKHCAKRPEIAPVVSQAAAWLVEMYAQPSGIPRRQAADALADRFNETQVHDAMDTWLATFRDAAAETALLESHGTTPDAAVSRQRPPET
jgi:hypothetical protein